MKIEITKPVEYKYDAIVEQMVRTIKNQINVVENNGDDWGYVLTAEDGITIEHLKLFQDWIESFRHTESRGIRDLVRNLSGDDISVEVHNEN